MTYRLITATFSPVVFSKLSKPSVDISTIRDLQLWGLIWVSVQLSYTLISTAISTNNNLGSPHSGCHSNSCEQPRPKSCLSTTLQTTSKTNKVMKTGLKNRWTKYILFLDICGVVCLLECEQSIYLMYNNSLGYSFKFYWRLECCNLYCLQLPIIHNSTAHTEGWCWLITAIMIYVLKFMKYSMNLPH